MAGYALNEMDGTESDNNRTESDDSSGSSDDDDDRLPAQHEFHRSKGPPQKRLPPSAAIHPAANRNSAPPSASNTKKSSSLGRNNHNNSSNALNKMASNKHNNDNAAAAPLRLNIERPPSSASSQGSEDSEPGFSLGRPMSVRGSSTGDKTVPSAKSKSKSNSNSNSSSKPTLAPPPSSSLSSTKPDNKKRKRPTSHSESDVTTAISPLPSALAAPPSEVAPGAVPDSRKRLMKNERSQSPLKRSHIRTSLPPSLPTTPTHHHRDEVVAINRTGGGSQHPHPHHTSSSSSKKKDKKKESVVSGALADLIANKKAEIDVLKKRKDLILKLAKGLKLGETRLADGGPTALESHRLDPMALAALAVSVLSDVIDDCVLDLCFEVHHAVKSGEWCSSCDRTLKGNAMMLNRANDVDNEEVLSRLRQGVDIYGNGSSTADSDRVECINCKRVVAAARYAPHLEKCMEVGGRNASRQAKERVKEAFNTSNANTLASFKDDGDEEYLGDEGDQSSQNSDPSGRARPSSALGAPKQWKKLKVPLTGEQLKPSQDALLDLISMLPIHDFPPIDLVSLNNVPPSALMSDEFEALDVQGRWKLRVVLDRFCGVMSANTGKLCGNTIKCPLHNTEQRDAVRMLILGSALPLDASYVAARKANSSKKRKKPLTDKQRRSPSPASFSQMNSQASDDGASVTSPATSISQYGDDVDFNDVVSMPPPPAYAIPVVRRR